MIQILKSLALLPVEKVLNQLLRNDPYLLAQLAPFHGKTLAVLSTSPATTVTCSIDAGFLHISSLSSEQLGLRPDAVISGKSNELIGMLTGDSTDRALANPAISISGDAVLVQELYSCFRQLDVQWSDYLAPLLGDVISNELEHVADSASRWSQNARQSLRRNIDDYLQEESDLLPISSEVLNFGADLDRLKLDIDRVQARAQRLDKHLDDLLSD